LVDDETSRKSLLTLVGQVIECLLFCKESGNTCDVLKQQFYMAMIDANAQKLDWECAAKCVNESFENVPSSLHKPLWKWRVVVMSKRGKRVLDAIQKLKESDPSLQARVFAILARSSSDPKQQAEAFYKSIDTMKSDIRRVEYVLETAQWMSSSGIPKSEIKELLLGALDSLYEIEEKSIEDEDSDTKNDDDTVSKTGSKLSGVSSRQVSRGKAPSAASTNRAKSKIGVGVGTSGVGPKSGTAASRSKRSSALGSSSVSAADGSDASIDPFTFTIQHVDFFVRTLAMVTILESDASTRLSRCLEMTYYLEKMRDIWSDSLRESFKFAAYKKLSQADKDATPFEDFFTSFPDEIIIPQRVTELMSWYPPTLFRECHIAGSMF